MLRKILLIITLVFIFSGVSFGQEFGFGFGDYTDEDADSSSGSVAASGSNSGLSSGLGSKSGLSIKFGGEIALEIAPYVYDFKEKEDGQRISFWDMASGKFNFTLSGADILAYVGVNLSYDSISDLWDPYLRTASYTPLLIDEAYLRAYIGPFNVEAGFRKLSWGKADSLGPLDVTNPLDYSDLRDISDLNSIKLARPMLHLTFNTGSFSKLEAVFIPNFAGHRFAQEGRWAASQYSSMADTIPAVIFARATERNNFYLNMLMSSIDPQQFASGFSNFSIPFPDTSTLNYFQTGLRFTTTIGPVDIGGQYFYGNLFLPSFTITTNGVDTFLDDIILQIPSILSGNPFIPHIDLLNPQIKYNRYHQIGIDYAQVVFGFNLRAEFAINLTEDLAGDDGSVRNPFIGWSFGFDRDLFWGIYANVQINETIRLLNNKVGNNPVFDSEAGTDVTSTRITMQISKKFLRDSLESKVSIIWDIENSGCYIIPAIGWSVGGLNAELAAGIFAGKHDGELGQYWENTFIKVGLKYSF